MATIPPELGVTDADVARFCIRWNVVTFELFGSALRDDFTPDSDVDVLITFAPDGKPRLHGLLEMETELATMFGRRVDMVERKLVERSPNWIRRNAILESARPVYAA